MKTHIFQYVIIVIKENLYLLMILLSIINNQINMNVAAVKKS